MKRRTYVATIMLEDENGDRTEIAKKTTFAWNSAIRGTEELIRNYARSQGALFTGDTPVSIGKGTLTPLYRRYWDGNNGQLIVAQVREVKP